MIVGVIAYFRHAARTAAHDAPRAPIVCAGRDDRVFVVEAALADRQLPFAISERYAVALERKAGTDGMVPGPIRVLRYR
jgi:hypothetical protein